MVDGRVPFPGTLHPSAFDSGAAIDFPGAEQFFFLGEKAANVPDDIKLLLKSEFRTWVVCGGKVIGFVSWSRTVTLTIKSEKVDSMDVSHTAAEFKELKEDEKQAKVVEDQAKGVQKK